MAIPNNYIDKITDHDSGGSRPICPPAEHVQVDNENFEGDTLDEVLDEVAQAIEDAGQGGYAPPQGGIPKSDLAQSVQDSLDKADSALQDEDVAEVAKTGDYDDLLNKPTIPDTSGLATKTELNAKQDTLVAGNGIVIGNDGKTVSVDAAIRTNAGKGIADVSSPQEDGSFTVELVNGNTYTVNLNHQHAQYQPLLSSANAGSNITITTDQQGNIIISATGGGGGGTQVQADWNQTDSTAVDFIKNKPTIPVVPTAVSAFTNDAGYLTQHQSLAGRVQSQDVVSIVKITQADYDDLQVKDSTTLYLITES